MTARSDDAIVTVDALTIAARADGAVLVDDVSLALRRGGVTGIVGESGSGKTLTCRSLLGVLPDAVEIRSGRIVVDGREVTGLGERQWSGIRGTVVSAVFQDPGSYLNPSVTIGRQLVEVLRVKRRYRRRAAHREAALLLGLVRLRDPEAVLRAYPHELSGGMLQRVLLAIAVALEPRVLIADEATTALDVTVQAEILDLLIDLQERIGLTLLVVSHDLAVIAQICDEVVVLKDGRVVEAGPTRQVIHHPRHPYTRLLVAEHERYGLDRFTAEERAHVA
ncbi:ABC transporter ATP-binding protein [Microbacterium telephonicum]|uniref:ABC-type dipeptide/oligopeptide/nickel transport system ATPase component n=1 Tax=Microbacterium telephonicum TaxID=1714841 RepID=A0A498CKU1_9MICO|nr:ABC transporter ATP-binding protein [Microbacterium telephonicum]RLK52681.1 ABC-type dipeptide/oligopeptide/nickel transport system ATPase component [Microbacterium telephonicum]